MAENPLDGYDPPKGPIEIDLRRILRARLTGWKRLLAPGWAVGVLERVVCQNELNAMLRYAWPSRGYEFSEKILAHLGIDVTVKGIDGLPDEPYVFASNHPLGGLDGIALVAVLGSRYGDDRLRVLVNDMLMNVEPLGDVFLPINKYGAQGRASAVLIGNAYADPRLQIVMFPAGLVSRLHDDGEIRDLKWQKAFASKALASGRKIVPVRFIALNSLRFYKAARRRKKLGIRVNIEQALLPSELVRCRGKHFEIRFGKPVDPAAMHARGLTPQQIADEVRCLSDVL